MSGNGNNQPISLPQGGGAIQGIGETFQPNLFSGTGNFSIPINISPGRDGFGPQLALQYSSGSGNGCFGLGWQLSTPCITRKTEKGLPTYTDRDVFVLSGAEDLVPCLQKVCGSQGEETWLREEPRIVADAGGREIYAVTRFRPRTEGLFARIEKWTKKDSPADVHWRVTSKDNTTSLYGKTPSARIFDSANPEHIYEWRIEETFDATGNHLLYEYVKDPPNLKIDKIFEQNHAYNQAYIRRILYGNTSLALNVNLKTGIERTATSHRDPTAELKRHYLFEVLFDYGDLPSLPAIPYDWPKGAAQSTTESFLLRDDPFSTFRAGFEIRTLRLCHRVLMLHHFKEGELDGAPLVKSTDFEYTQNDDTHLSFLMAVKARGYRKDPQDNFTYLTRSMPPVSFKYSEFRPDEQKYQSVTAAAGDFPPRALNAPNYTLMSLYGNGLPDILHATATGYYCWENLGHGELGFRRALDDCPAGVDLSAEDVAVGDMGGDGLPDIIVSREGASGFFEARPDGKWKPFRRFEKMPSFSLADPNTRLLDLTGDGLSDVLVAREHHFLWFKCLGERGYDDPQLIERQHDLDDFPDIYFTDSSGRVRLADMTGDGLSDIVMIHSGRVDYWPNLGYGRFGRRVTMTGSPQLATSYDPRRLFLVDLDGTGCADLVYVEAGEVHFWFNRSGNGWSDRRVINGTPVVSDATAIQFADFVGTGTATLVWSYDYQLHPDGNYKVLDFCGGVKPYLLSEMSNNMGATTRARYAPSTKFYLQDKKAGSPWITSLPFPVQVLEKTEIIDHISKTKLVTTYQYHHGYYDGQEREFRGFGRVDQYDCEVFNVFAEEGLHGGDAEFTNGKRAHHLPPLLTKNWFHTGVYFDANRPSANGAFYDKEDMTTAYSKEFYRGDGQAPQLLGPEVASTDAPHEAYRALRGTLLRLETYALDGTDKEPHPFTVTQNRYCVKTLQPRAGNHHAVYLTRQNESISCQYERNPEDPRIGHQLYLEYDDEFGLLKKQLSIGYGRRFPSTAPELTDEDKLRQTRALITYTEHTFTNAIGTPNHYRAPLPAETKKYEMTGVIPQDNVDTFSFEAWSRDNFALATAAAEIPYEEGADLISPQRRLIEHVRTVYRKDDLTGVLPLGELEPLALPGGSYKLAFSPSMLDQMFVRKKAGEPDELLQPRPSTFLAGKGADGGGYVYADGNWWIPSGRTFFDSAADVINPERTAASELQTASEHFFRIRKHTDPFDHSSVMSYDDYDLMLTGSSDALGNTVAAEIDYRVLKPWRVIDPNNNRAAVAFGALGMVAATAVMGKAGENKGDRLEGFPTDPSLDGIRSFMSNPKGNAASVLGRATDRIVHDIDRYRRCGQPPVSVSLARETHFNDLAAQEDAEIQLSFSYFDGFGRQIQKKVQTQAGNAPQRSGCPQPSSQDAQPGELIKNQDGQLSYAQVSPRWVGSGRTVFNNKGKPVRQYEPFFSSTHLFEPEHEVFDTGVSPTFFYDPQGRLVATLHPNHTYEKIVFEPWKQIEYDVNDTLFVSHAVALSPNPADDPDVGHFFRATDDAEYLPTWYELRTDTEQALKNWPDTDGLGRTIPGNAKRRAAEKAAAHKAAAHSDTPSTGYFDTLGRLFLTVAHNSVVCDDHPHDGKVDKTCSRTDLDIEGNRLAVWDERRLPDQTMERRLVVQYGYSLAGAGTEQRAGSAKTNLIYKRSMEAGERWILTDVAQNPIRIWDSRGSVSRLAYDEARRPTEVYVAEDGVERLAKRTTYGEPQGDANNHRTRIYKTYDDAGVVTNVAYDFRGNLLETQRDVLPTFDQPVDWQQEPIANYGSYTHRTTYDALNRAVSAVTPDQSTYRASFNDAGLINGVEVNLRGERENGLPKWTAFVTNIEYNEKGQRVRIEYGCGRGANSAGVTTTYTYDTETYRLLQMKTNRGAGFNETVGAIFEYPKIVQHLHYTYDAAGNITRIEDAALKSIRRAGKKVQPIGSYTYDALYRLIEAKGREHIGQNVPDVAGIDNNYRDFPFAGCTAHPNDLQALRHYTELYEYDAVGNIESWRHIANGGSWTRTYKYQEASLIEPAKHSNRLTQAPTGAATSLHPEYTYDAHGNMKKMPHLPAMIWDVKDQLQQVDLGGGGRAYYVYDAEGQRVRKVIVDQHGIRRKERLYLGGYEIYREFYGVDAAISLQRDTLHVSDNAERIAVVETQTVGATAALPAKVLMYQLGNHLGSASVELDQDGALISFEEFHPYGSTALQAKRSAAEVSLKRYRYTGRERDEESGLYYHGVRYYAPWLGRWTACDPAGMADGTNSYNYVRNNPLTFLDSEGECALLSKAYLGSIAVGGPGSPVPPRPPRNSNTKCFNAVTETGAYYFRNSLTAEQRNNWYNKSLPYLEKASAPFPNVSAADLGRWILFEWPTYFPKTPGRDEPLPLLVTKVSLTQYLIAGEDDRAAMIKATGDFLSDKAECIAGPFAEGVKGLGITNLRPDELLKEIRTLEILQSRPNVPTHILSIAKESKDSTIFRKELWANDEFSYYVLAATMQGLFDMFSNMPEEDLEKVKFAYYEMSFDPVNETGKVPTMNDLIDWAIEHNAGSPASVEERFVRPAAQDRPWWPNTPQFDQVSRQFN